MTSLRWVAEGIEVAEAAGGVTLERRRRVGFASGTEIRQRSTGELAVSGFEVAPDPDPFEDDD